MIDIDLRVFAQGYGAFLNSAFGLPNLTPNNLLGDGVDANDVSFSNTFPYVATPHQGYEVPRQRGRRADKDGGGAWPAGRPLHPG